MDLNEVILCGRLGRDAEVATTPGGVDVFKFSVATSKRWKGKDGQWQDKTNWHNIVYFSHSQALSDYCKQALTKGSICIVKGELEYREYKDKQGVDKKMTQVVAQSVIVPGFVRAKDAPKAMQADFTEEDLPF